MSHIKECFVSRFKDGVILEADYSQLETIGLALVSGDAQLHDEIREGVDFHCVTASIIHGVEYDYIKRKVAAGDSHWKKIRQESKAPRFALQYGAGAQGIAKQSSLSVEQAREYIDAYYKRYPDVKAWQESVAEEVEKNKKPCLLTERADGTKIFGYKSYYTSMTGRRYVFTHTDDDRGFSPTQMKNFPVQGISTGDIVPMMLGYVYKKFFETNWHRDALLINTVHDSIIVDVNSESTAVVLGKAMEYWMERVPELLQEHFGIETDLPFNVDVSIAKSWAETK